MKTLLIVFGLIAVAGAVAAALLVPLLALFHYLSHVMVAR